MKIETSNKYDFWNKLNHRDDEMTQNNTEEQAGEKTDYRNTTCQNRNQ